MLGASTDEEGRSRMFVEVDLYSGRPNPRFSLEAGAAAELARRLGALAADGGGGRPYDGLGYRGLRVLGGAEEVLLSGGVVTVRGPGGSARRLRDPGRELERWLLDRGAGELDPEVVAEARRELAR
ncbi:hypothetical protein [Kitasatospora sp. NPDC101183]|uniref:hypothetical protein n=1 Tax=Kitasatospora sp. NPDC101183 TaxID=3364100 RepID=UPI0037FD32D1